jgi:circadian clock protein KaiC
VELQWQSSFDGVADALAGRLLDTVRARGTKRLFIDGIGGFRDALVYPDRTRRFFNRLFSELRALGVATMVSDESRHLSEIELPDHPLTALLDNVISLRHAEVVSRVPKIVSVMKMRRGASGTSSRWFWIGPQGFVVAPEELAPPPHAETAK